MLLESVDEHSRKHRSLRGERRSGTEVHGVQIGYDPVRVGRVRVPVGTTLEHALYRRVVTRFRQEFQSDGCLTFPLGSVNEMFTIEIFCF